MAMTSNQKRASAAALATALAIPAEGIRQYAYFDPPGVLTVCYGHTGSDVVADKLYPMTLCRALLTEDMRKAVDIVDRCVPGLPEPILAAFADAVFNLGPRVACDTGSSTAARMLKAGGYYGACQQLTRWNRATVLGVSVVLPGLTKRRALERDLCLQGTA